MSRDGLPSVLFRVSFFACALPVVPQFVKLAMVMFIELFVTPSEQTGMRSVERKEVFQIGERGIGRDGEGDVTGGRRRGEGRFSDGVRMSLIKVSNHASCVRHVFFWFPHVFLLG